MIAVSIRFTSSAAMRKFSAVSSISPSASAAYGLPCSSDSSRAKSSRRSSIRSAMAWQIFARPQAESAAHFGWAARAAATARAMSSAPASGASASVSPVTGETTARALSPVEGTHSPPMKFSRVRTVTAMGLLSNAGATVPFLREWSHASNHGRPGTRSFSRRTTRRAGRRGAAVLRGVLRDLRARQRGGDRAGALPAPGSADLLPGPQRAGDGAHLGRLRADEEPARDACMYHLHRAGRDEPRHRRGPRHRQPAPSAAPTRGRVRVAAARSRVATARGPVARRRLRERRAAAGVALLRSHRAAGATACGGSGAMRVLVNQAETGAATLAFPQDVQAEAFDYPDEFLAHRVWHVPRPEPDSTLLAEAAAL